MSDTPTSPQLPAPAAPSGSPPASSLQGDAASSKAMIEGWMAQGPSSPYWRGTADLSAERIQEHYRSLLRGELSGSASEIGPVRHGPDLDHPLSAEHYNIAAADGARSMSAADRDVIDTFLPVAFKSGLGQRKVVQAIGWCLSVPGLTAHQFEDLAIAAGWDDGAIEVCLGWYRGEAARRGMQV
jgi:hypothetical protein